jgi:hypothetical protein
LAELGFLGFAMIILVHTPFLWGQTLSRGDLEFSTFLGFFRRMAWFMVTQFEGVAWNERNEGMEASMEGVNW